MSQPEIEGRLAGGIRLFNRGDFFEAHEVWEQEWKITEGAERIFYQGLIQSAVALLHIKRGNYAGALSVYLKSARKLAAFPPVWMGIELAEFRSAMRRHFAPLERSSNLRGANCRWLGVGEIGAFESPPTIKWLPN
jgi:uncharacterized protein